MNVAGQQSIVASLTRLCVLLLCYAFHIQVADDAQTPLAGVTGWLFAPSLMIYESQFCPGIRYFISAACSVVIPDRLAIIAYDPSASAWQVPLERCVGVARIVASPDEHALHYII
jgi:hypothetical protein